MNKKNKKPSYRVSVVIPAYNAGEYLTRTIDSVLGQTRRANEVIVVDDGSTDNTAEVSARYGDKVKYIRQENAGASVARNTGIQAASYEWIAFLDGDDQWEPVKLERQMELLERNPELVWAGANFTICFCRENRKTLKLEPERGKELLNGKDYFEDYFQAYYHFAAGWTGTMVIRKDILEKAGLFRPGQVRFNDDDMWFRIAYREPRLGYLSEPLAIYHINVPDSITKTYLDPGILIDFMERHVKTATKMGKYDQFRPCAEKILRYWIHRYWQTENIFFIREMITRFSRILPGSYRFPVWVLTIFPRVTRAALPILSWINKWIRLRV